MGVLGAAACRCSWQLAKQLPNSNRSGKGDKDLGIRLIHSYLRIIARKKFKKGSTLKYWILENVPNVQKYIQDGYTAKDLGLEGGFILDVKHSNSGIYNAKDYGVPSKRKRFFCGEFPTPKPTISGDESLIPLKGILTGLGRPLENLKSEIKDPNYDFSMKSRDLTDHHYVFELPKFQWLNAKRLKEDRGYMGKMAFPEDIDRPSRTIMATLSFSARESFILQHNEKRYRSPTIREVASLMSFPIDYRFYGTSLETKYRLVGNAVPPRLAYAFAKAMADNEGLKVKTKYTPIKHKDKVNFINLNFIEFPLRKEMPRRPTARFKYHIPYMIIDAYRVELTNHHSDFKKPKFKWDVEIHKSQGPRAKVFTPNVGGVKISSNEKEQISSFVRSLENNLVNPDALQKIYCMTEKERRFNNLLGPYELLKQVKRFIERDIKGLNQDTYITIKEEPYKLPINIAIGYYTMVLAIKTGGKNHGTESKS